jgi:putative transposase
MLLDWGVSIRRACRVLPFDTSSYHYQFRRTDPAFLKKRIKEICETHVRYGYRRVYYILRRDDWSVNMKKVYRLYRELGASALLRFAANPFMTSWRWGASCAS